MGLAVVCENSSLDFISWTILVIERRWTMPNLLNNNYKTLRTGQKKIMVIDGLKPEQLPLVDSGPSKCHW